MAKDKPIRNKALETAITNALISRANFFRALMEQKRDINKECNYPDVITAPDYRAMFDREGLAARVVKLFPEETWSHDPDVFETDDQDEETAFEKSFKLNAEHFGLFSFLQRADIMSGIGSFGVILLGVNDGKKLSEPIEGIDVNGDKVGATPTDPATPTTKPPVANLLTTVKEEPETKDPDISIPLAKRQLLFLRVFDEALVEIVEYEKSEQSKRFGQPTLYNLKFIDVTTTAGSVQEMITKTTDEKVHWSRIIHIADNCLSSEVIGTPRMQNVYNRLYDLRKILGADGEGFWKGGFPGISIETQAGIENPELNVETTAEMMSDYMEGMKRYLALVGMTAKSLAVEIGDPTPHFTIQMQAIAVSIGCPLEVLLGNNVAKLSVGAGDGPQQRTWKQRVMRRQNTYVTPNIIRKFVDRLIAIDVLLPPTEINELGGYVYQVEWPDLMAPSEKEIADTFALLIKALAEYVSGNVSSVVPPLEMLTILLHMDPEEAQAILEAAGDRLEELEPAPEPTHVDVTTGKPIPMDEFGTPMMPPKAPPPPKGFPKK